MKASELFPSTRGAFGMFDSVELIPAINPKPYSGSMLDDLYARVDNTIALNPSRRTFPSSIDLDGEILEECSPWLVVVNARMHVTEGSKRYPMDEDDAAAWRMMIWPQTQLVGPKRSER